MNEIDRGTKLGHYYGEVPLGGVEVTFNYYDIWIPGKWVTIVDKLNKPILLSDVKVYGSK